MLKELHDKFKVPIQFRYVPTDQNPADLLTRGLSFEMFKQKLDFWLYGPDWIRSSKVVWPASELQCLSSVNKSIVMHTTVAVSAIKKIEPNVPFKATNKLKYLKKIL